MGKCCAVKSHGICKVLRLFRGAIGNAHLVLRKGACLVCADYRCCAHSLASVHLAHQSVAGSHLAHTVCQTQGYAHRQPLRNCNHNYGNRYHKETQEDIHIYKPGILQRDYAQHYISGCEGDEEQYGYGNAHLPDKRAQPAKLSVQRGLVACNGGCLTGGASNLRGISNCCYKHYSFALRYSSTPVEHIWRVCSGILLHLYVALGAWLALSVKLRLICFKVHRVQQSAICRNFVALLNNNNIALYHLALGYGLNRTLPAYLHRGIVINLIQNIKLLSGAIFVYEGNEGCKQYGNNNAYALYHRTVKITGYER